MPNQAPDQIPEDTEQLEGGISATNVGSTSDYAAIAKARTIFNTVLPGTDAQPITCFDQQGKITNTGKAFAELGRTCMAIPNTQHQDRKAKLDAAINAVVETLGMKEQQQQIVLRHYKRSMTKQQQCQTLPFGPCKAVRTTAKASKALPRRTQTHERS